MIRALHTLSSALIIVGNTPHQLMKENNMKTKAEQLEELKATAVKLQQQIEALEKPKQWKPTVSLNLVDLAHISTYTLLLQYVKEFGGNWEADWGSISQEKCFVAYSYIDSDRVWDWNTRCSVCTIGAVYMSRKCAKALAAKLNSGEVVL
tara:strand:+ start:241 stop:690 length:450 start_codon:yes stop_codon:yes gene_type:complete